MQRSFLNWTIFISALCLLLQACVTAETASEHLGKPAYSSRFFWQVTKAGKTSYLLGTIHYGVHLEELPNAITEKLRASRTVFIENTTANQQKMREGFASGKGTLKRQLSPQGWDNLKAASHLDERMLSTLMPWAAYLILAQTPLAKYASAQLDEEIEERAQNQKIPVLSLDDPAQVTALLTRVFTTEVLEHALQDPDLFNASEMDAEFQATKRAYQEGNQTKLKELLSRDQKRCACQADALITERNPHWMTKLLPQLNEGGVFVAAGALHFLGDGGIPELLKQRGFRVEEY